MDPFDQMELKQPEFTKTDQHIYESIMENVDDVLRSNSMTLALKYGVSQAALTRFCQKLGFRGYSDFSAAMFLAKKAQSAIVASSHTAVDDYCDLIRKVPLYMDDQDIESAIERICKARLIYASGAHRSSFPARQLCYNLQTLGLPCVPLSTDDAGTAFHAMSIDDVWVIFSARGTSFKQRLDELRKGPKERQPFVVLVCVNPKHPIRKRVDMTIMLPNWQNQNMKHYLETQVPIMVFVDLFTAFVAQHLESSGIQGDNRWDDRA